MEEPHPQGPTGQRGQGPPKTMHEALFLSTDLLRKRPRDETIIQLTGRQAQSPGTEQVANKTT